MMYGRYASVMAGPCLGCVHAADAARCSVTCDGHQLHVYMYAWSGSQVNLNWLGPAVPLHHCMYVAFFHSKDLT